MTGGHVVEHFGPDSQWSAGRLGGVGGCGVAGEPGRVELVLRALGTEQAEFFGDPLVQSDLQLHPKDYDRDPFRWAELDAMAAPDAEQRSPIDTAIEKTR